MQTSVKRLVRRGRLLQLVVLLSVNHGEQGSRGRAEGELDKSNSRISKAWRSVVQLSGEARTAIVNGQPT